MIFSLLKEVIMSWHVRGKRALARGASLLLLTGCTLAQSDVQLRKDIAVAIQNHEQAILTLGQATQLILQVLQEKGFIKIEAKKEEKK